MKKVFIFIGSRKKTESNSYRFINLLMNELRKKSSEALEFNQYFPDDIAIKSCLGCTKCFDTGNCALDKIDKFEEAKESMLRSDLIVFISPVYAHNVTGDMKVFLDRISYWMHLFRLAGKKSIGVSISSTNGNSYVNSYLKKVLELLGTQVISNLAITVDGPAMLDDIEYTEKMLPKIADKICEQMYSSTFETSREQEKFYKNMRKMYQLVDVANRKNSAEYQYWEKTGMLNYDSLQMYVEHKFIDMSNER